MKQKSIFTFVSFHIHRCRKLHSSLSVSNSLVFDEEKGNQEKKIHKYEERWKYRDVESTSKHLLEHVVYDNGGVVAINKPSGLGSSSKEPTIYHCIPHLAEKLGYKDLCVVTIPDKFTSGVTILATSSSVANNIRLAVRRSKSIYTKDPRKSYLSVTIGHPVDIQSPQHYAVASHFQNKKVHNFMLREWGKNEAKRKKVFVGTIGHSILSTSATASLVLVSAWQERLNFPRLFLTDILISPALGDQTYGPRVGLLYGKPILLKPGNAPAVKALEPPLLEAVRVRSGSEALIPLHFHLYEVLLHSFLGKGTHLVLRAEPPDFFKWTCEKLNLELPRANRYDIVEDNHEPQSHQ